MRENRVERPFVFQDQTLLCGPTCLTLDIEAHGKKVPLGAQAIFCSTSSKKGTSCANMVWGARLSQMHVCTGTDGSVALIRRCIDKGLALHVFLINPERDDEGSKYNHRHFVLITGYSGRHVFFHNTDPEVQGGGADIKMSTRKLLKMWRWDRRIMDPSLKWFMVVAPHKVSKHFKKPAMFKPKRKKPEGRA